MIPGWLDTIEDEVAVCLASRGSLSARELAEALQISEACAISYVALLASAGRLTIERVSLPTDRRGKDRPGRRPLLSWPDLAA